MPTDREDELLGQGLAHLRALDIAARASRLDFAGGGRDAMVRLQGRDVVADYSVAIQLRPTAAGIQSLAGAQATLLITPSMPERLAEIARDHGVNYVDAAGNMYVRGDGLVLDVRGRRPAKAYAAPGRRSSRAFKATGLQVLFVLLADPERLNLSYRDLAACVDASVGTVHGVLADLEAGGYVLQRRKQRHLYRTRDLFDRWVDAYALTLYDRLSLARFDTPDPSWWRNADEDLRTAGAQWGGETAVHHLDPRLRPQGAVIYADVMPARLIAQCRLTTATDGGSVELRRRFWRSVDDDRLTVPTPLIYADLLASANPRLLTAAAELRTNDALLQRLDRS